MTDDSAFDGQGAGRATYTVLLDALEISASLGIHPTERAAPQRVLVSVWLYCDYGETAPADRIDAVVDYDFLRDRIRALAASRHFELQETLCDEIAALALADRRVTGARVRTMKTDIYPDARIGCEVLRRRGA
ncbi:dihydroneopterin aldolase [Sphingomonas sp. NFR15]|uniref:dihydroneopterin aldolase n=1 Tax=Sphingomonas sp. NFR15 TaxID=1566282 RepID=UPI0008894768|nr:dihydroneopterin aldolase [Sphingomonas sp. NFR15]SDA29015.1 dihydroneopterin aldolase [Sphingomonas sp. NFR15]